MLTLPPSLPPPAVWNPSWELLTYITAFPFTFRAPQMLEVTGPLERKETQVNLELPGKGETVWNNMGFGMSRKQVWIALL